jgi:hypothetical protein
VPPLPRLFPGSGRRCIVGVACNHRHGHGCAWSRHCGPPLDELSPCSGARVAQAGRTAANRRRRRPHRRPAEPDHRLPCSASRGRRKGKFCVCSLLYDRQARPDRGPLVSV